MSWSDDGAKWTRGSWKSVNLLGTESLNSVRLFKFHVVGLITCKREGLVVGDEVPVGGVAQVGVKVIGVEVGVMEKKKGKKTRKCGER